MILLVVTAGTWIIAPSSLSLSSSSFLTLMATIFSILLHCNSLYILYGLDYQDGEIEERERRNHHDDDDGSNFFVNRPPPIQEIDPSVFALHGGVPHVETSAMTEDTGIDDDGDNGSDGDDNNDHQLEKHAAAGGGGGGVAAAANAPGGDANDGEAWNLYVLQSMPSSYDSDLHLQNYPEDVYRLGFDYGSCFGFGFDTCCGGAAAAAAAANDVSFGAVSSRRSGDLGGTGTGKSKHFFMYYACYFLLVTLLSSTILIGRLQQQHPVWKNGGGGSGGRGRGATWDFSMWTTATSSSCNYWIQVLCWITYGMYVAGAALSYIHRHWIDDVSFKRNKVFLMSSMIVAFMCFMLMYLAWNVHSSVLRDVQSFLPTTSSDAIDDNVISSTYYGDAWVVDYEILTDTNDDLTIDEEDQVEEIYSHNGGIPVNVTVVWGGNWACPTNSDLFCKKTITTRVSLTFWDSFLLEYKQAAAAAAAAADQDDDNGYGEQNTSDLVDMYVYHRYHSYDSDDDGKRGDADNDDYNDYDEPPSYTYWNRPGETVWATCDDTCKVQSFRWVGEHFANYSNSFHGICVSFGMGILLMAWPIYMACKESKIFTKLSPEPGPLETTLVPKETAILA